MFDREVAGRLLRSRPVWVVTVLLLAGAAWWFSGDSKRPAQKGPAAGMAQMVPVRVEVARIEDLDIYLKGLGTVTAFNTVTVRSRVQGELISVRFKEGEQVKAGELLAEIDPRSFEVALSQAIGMQQQNQAQYENAKRDLDRYRTLRKQDSIAPMLLDTQQALVRKLEGQLKSDQAAVDNARLQLDYTRITAPISGRLGLRKVDAGNLVIANDPQGVVVITQTQPISVLFTLAETDLPAVRSAMQEDQKLPVDAYDRSDLNRLAVGTLVTVDNQIDATTGTVKLKAQFANENDALFPQHIRRKGEDIAEKSIVLTDGQRLGPQHLAMLASIGVGEVSVYRRLKIGIFFTGDELTEPGTPLAPGAIYNSNRYAISALLKQLGCNTRDYGIIRDSADATREALALAAKENDIVITCGGVSVGEEDHVKAAVQSLGRLDLWQISMKPGKPLAYGKIGVTDFIGLPGNPVSSFVTFLLMARPFILKRMGVKDHGMRYMTARAGFEWPRPDKRREFLRVRLERDANEQNILRLWPNQGSGVMSSLAWADGLVDLAADTPIKAGDKVRYLSLSDLLN